ncbi:MAG: 3-phosphoshikimate 1-carboxyvinyltransferase [Oscillospiraceae bacterium]|nr:3-phosphoshikimate 1-carboxyvinyltransferase [Oscillospiraceae bacterium]
MNVTIRPTLLKGGITPPPSKSQTHRAVIAAALAGGVSTLRNVARSQDIQATLDCMTALGACPESAGQGAVRVHGMGAVISDWQGLPRFDCGESGSTLRFLIPVALAAAGGGSFTGRGRLMERPQQPYFDIFEEKGIFYEQKDGVLTVKGGLEPGTFKLPGNVSSQFITGLLYALPLLAGDSEILLTTPLESEGYVDMTLEVLGRFGIRVRRQGDCFYIPGGQQYQSRDMDIEADWSQAAFWYAACALGSGVDIQGMNAFSTQGDMAVVPYCLKLTAPGEVELDVSQCPDLVPALAAMAAVRQGTTYIVNAARLRIKESDRLAAVADVLDRMGADVTEQAEGLTIVGRDGLAGGVSVDSYNDHRIAMMAAIAATRCAHPVTVVDAGCVAKSYPNFWEDYEALGGAITRD